MKYLHSTFIAALITFFPFFTFAENFRNNKIEVTGNFRGFEKFLPGTEDEISRTVKSRIGSSYRISPINLKTRLAGIGRVNINFDRRRFNSGREARFFDGKKFINNSNNISLFKGSVQITEGEFPAAGAIFKDKNGNRILKISLSGKRIGKSRINAFTLKVNLNQIANRKIANVAKSPLIRTLDCLANQKPFQARSLNPITGEPIISTATVFKVLEIAIYADAEWYAKFGEASNQELIALLNAAETIYESQLQVSFDIINTTTITSNPLELVTREATLLLYNFGNWITDNNLGKTPDIVHMISGKDFLGSTSGLAWVGTVCHPASQYYKTGLSQYTNASVAHLIFAHELGHNFDATHDPSLPASIMFPSMGVTHNQFSENSKQQILNYIAQKGVCLGEVEFEVTPTPIPTATALSDSNDDDYTFDAEPTVSVSNIPISPTVNPKPDTQKRYQVKAKFSFGKRKDNKLADKFNPKVYIKNPISGLTVSKKLTEDLKFGLKLPLGTYQVSIELKKRKRKSTIEAGQLLVAGNGKRILLNVMPEALNQSITALTSK